MNKLYQVTARHFCAGILVNKGTIVQAAPILKWCESHEFDNFRLYCRKRYWAIIDVDKHIGGLVE